MPTFSIVIPTYNRANLLCKAIESVIAQTFADWELLVVDDGSTDNTKELVLLYASKDQRIKYIYQKNAERSAARNNGISHAAGKYICFLDSDDYYLPTHLSALHQYIVSSHSTPELIITGLLAERDNEIYPVPLHFDEKTNVYNNLCFQPFTPNKCVLSDIIKTCRFNPQLSIGEDLELWLRVASRCKKIEWITHQQTVVIKEHEDRSVNVFKTNSGIKQLLTYDVIFSKNHSLNKIDAHIRKQLYGNCYFNISKYYLYNRQKIKAAYWMLRVIFSNLSNKQLKYRLNILIQIFVDYDKALQLITN
jgi:glycosyltransferase involved in cell wall biosynthesis